MDRARSNAGRRTLHNVCFGDPFPRPTSGKNGFSDGPLDDFPGLFAQSRSCDADADELEGLPEFRVKLKRKKPSSNP